MHEYESRISIDRVRSRTPDGYSTSDIPVTRRPMSGHSSRFSADSSSGPSRLSRFRNFSLPSSTTPPPLPTHNIAWDSMSRIGKSFESARTGAKSTEPLVASRPTTPAPSKQKSLFSRSKEMPEMDEKRRKRLHLAPWEATESKRMEKKKRSWLRIALKILLGLLFLGALVNLFVIDGKVLTPILRAGGIERVGEAQSDYFTCLSLFNLTAPTSPLTHPCRACMAIVATGDRTETASRMLEFCALKDVFEATSGNANGTETRGGALVNAGWMQDAAICTWGGVTCQGGRVTNLTLETPAVPSTMPPTLGFLDRLEALIVLGTNTLPAGALTSFSRSLSSLHLERTGLAGQLGTFGEGLTVLELINNPTLGVLSLPSTPLTTLSIAGSPIDQDASLFFAGFANSRLSLKSIILSNSGLSGVLPDLSAFAALQSLIVSGNALTGLSALPPSLTTLDLSRNPSLAGTLSLGTCSTVVDCDLAGSAVTVCGSCPA